MADVRGGTAVVGALYEELSYRSARPEFKDSLGINMTMKKIFIFVSVQTIKKTITRSKRVSFSYPYSSTSIM